MLGSNTILYIMFEKYINYYVILIIVHRNVNCPQSVQHEILSRREQSTLVAIWPGIRDVSLSA